MRFYIVSNKVCAATVAAAHGTNNPISELNYVN